MPTTSSPLRYPGGKSQLIDFLGNLLFINNLNDIVYCEPFAGGFGAGLSLLYSNRVKSVIINDVDIAIYSFWYAALNETELLLERIINTKVDITEWFLQRKSYNELVKLNSYSLDLAFATLFLNRTNVSGIISGGPIGGIKQESKYTVDCRFNKKTLTQKIRKIATYKEKIDLYNLDANDLIKNVLLNHDKTALFTFFDPPYYQQGKNLYTNFFAHSDHVLLKNNIDTMSDFNWIVTYDNEKEIEEIYRNYEKFVFGINYSANTRIKAEELMFKSRNLKVQPFKKIQFK